MRHSFIRILPTVCFLVLTAWFSIPRWAAAECLADDATEAAGAETSSPHARDAAVPPLHPLVVAAWQLLFSVFVLAAFSPAGGKQNAAPFTPPRGSARSGA